MRVASLFFGIFIFVSLGFEAWAQLSPGKYSIADNVSGAIQNLRSGPGQGHSIVVSIPADAQNVIIGECRSPDDGRSRSNWCRAEWSGYSGWISSCCLLASPPPVVTSENTKSPDDGSASVAPPTDLQPTKRDPIIPITSAAPSAPNQSTITIILDVTTGQKHTFDCNVRGKMVFFAEDGSTSFEGKGGSRNVEECQLDYAKLDPKFSKALPITLKPPTQDAFVVKCLSIGTFAIWPGGTLFSCSTDPDIFRNVVGIDMRCDANVQFTKEGLMQNCLKRSTKKTLPD